MRFLFLSPSEFITWVINLTGLIELTWIIIDVIIQNFKKKNIKFIYIKFQVNNQNLLENKK